MSSSRFADNTFYYYVLINNIQALIQKALKIFVFYILNGKSNERIDLTVMCLC